MPSFLRGATKAWFSFRFLLHVFHAAENLAGGLGLARSAGYLVSHEKEQTHQQIERKHDEHEKRQTKNERFNPIAQREQTPVSKRKQRASCSEQHPVGECSHL